MIEIKSCFSDWHKVSFEQAKNYVEFLLSHITNVKSDNKIRYIEQNHLRGISVNELLSEAW